MKHLKEYIIFESKIDDISTCLYDLTDIGFKPEIGGLNQTKDFKKEKSEENLILALKLVKSVENSKFSGYFEGTFTKDSFNLPKVINPNNDERLQRNKFSKFEKDLLDTIGDSANKIINLYLKNSTNGTYIVNQYGVVYGTCVVVILKFYK